MLYSFFRYLRNNLLDIIRAREPLPNHGSNKGEKKKKVKGGSGECHMPLPPNTTIRKVSYIHHQQIPSLFSTIRQSYILKL